MQYRLLLNLNGHEQWWAIKPMCLGAPRTPGHGCPCRVVCFVTGLEKTDPIRSHITGDAVIKAGYDLCKCLSLVTSEQM